MATECISVSLEEPMKVLKACSFLLSELDADASENIYAYEGMSIISDLVTDAVSRLDDEQEKKNNE